LQVNLLFSLEFAERLKRMVLSLAAQADRATQIVMGKSMTGHNPLELHIGSKTLRSVAIFFQTELFAMVRSLLQQLPPELLQDVMSKGVLLTGGLAHIHGLEEALTNEFGMPVALLEEAEVLALMGASEMMRAGMV
jgi:rod shape-determining protein MreB